MEKVDIKSDYMLKFDRTMALYYIDTEGVKNEWQKY